MTKPNHQVSLECVGGGGSREEIESGCEAHSTGPLLLPVALKSAFQTHTLGNSGCPVSENRLNSSWLGPKGMWWPRGNKWSQVWVFQTLARSQETGQGDRWRPSRPAHLTLEKTKDLGCGPCLWTHGPDGPIPDERTGGDVLPLCDPPQHPISAGPVLDLVRQMTAFLKFDPVGSFSAAAPRQKLPAGRLNYLRMPPHRKPLTCSGSCLLTL